MIGSGIYILLPIFYTKTLRMKLQTIDQKWTSGAELENFLDQVYQSKMSLLASSLLEKGLSPDEINEAVERAFHVCEAAGISTRQHFCFLYTQRGQGLMRDCKLTRMAYQLVLLNANTKNKAVASFQLKVLSKYNQE